LDQLWYDLVIPRKNEQIVILQTSPKHGFEFQE